MKRRPSARPTRRRRVAAAAAAAGPGAGARFVNEPRLRETSVLDPHWVTDGVYRLLRGKDGPGSDGI